MKFTLHIPTEQYGFIAAEVEGTPTNAVEEYQDIQKAWVASKTAGDGLKQKEWNDVLDSYILISSITSDAYERMNVFQKNVIQEIKKHKKRHGN